MQLKDLLKEHSRFAGVALALDDHGLCHLVINDEHVINLEVGSEDNFFLYAQVTRLPDTGNETLFRTLLQANLYGKRTQGLTFALDSHGTQVILFKELLVAHSDFASYYATLQLFVNQLAFWKQELSKVSDPGSTSQEGSEGKGPGGWIKL